MANEQCFDIHELKVMLESLEIYKIQLEFILIDAKNFTKSEYEVKIKACKAAICKLNLLIKLSEIPFGS